jgi:hypothetical protein
VREFGSQGTCGSPSGIRICREFQLFSSLEETYFFLLERDPNVIDIREQFPILDLSTTLKLCAERGVKHMRRKGQIDPFTLDFLVRRRSQNGSTLHARSIKTETDAADEDTRDRLAIEYLWCEAVQLDWALVDTKDFDDVLLSSLRFVRAWHLHRFVPNPNSMKRLAEQFHASYRTGLPLQELIDAVASQMRCSTSYVDDAFRYCAWANLIPVDLRRPVHLSQSLVLQS